MCANKQAQFQKGRTGTGNRICERFHAASSAAPIRPLKERKPMKSFRRTFLFAVLALLASAPAFGATHTNTIIGTSFNPRNMTIKAGDTIVWINVQYHSVTGPPGEPFCGSGVFMNPSD